MQLKQFPEHVFFDLDGTLLEVSERYYQVFQQGDKNLNKDYTKEYYWQCKRAKVKESELQGREQLAPSALAAFNLKRGNLLEHPQHLKLDCIQPGCMELLNFFQIHSIPMSVVTMRHDKSAMVKQLSQLKIQHYFQKLLCKGDIVQSQEVKCDLIKQNYPLLSYQRCWLIGDSETDLYTADQMSMLPVHVNSGIRDRNHLSYSSTCTWFVDDLKHLVSHLNSQQSISH